MKIAAIQNYKHKFPTRYQNTRSNFTFCANSNNIDTFERTFSPEEIHEFDNYRKNLHKIKYRHDMKFNNTHMPIIAGNLEYIYSNVPYKLFGLIPYCGVEDVSNEINRYKSGREQYVLSNNVAKTYCDLLEFSLKELDKRFGKHSGIVYRGGFFDPNVSQFYSTMGTFFLGNLISLSNGEQISIIETKNGHRINKFQDKFLTKHDAVRKAFLSESEILISNPENYIEVTNSLNPQSFKDRQLMNKKEEIIKGVIREGYNSTKNMTNDEIRDMVHVYREV